MADARRSKIPKSELASLERSEPGREPRETAARQISITRPRSGAVAEVRGSPSASEAPAGAELALGQRLRELRKARRQTLDSLAGETGLTKGYLSKVETGSKIPPIATLTRVARALGTDLATLLQAGGSTPIMAHGSVSLVRAHERRQVVRGGSAFGYDYQALAHRIASKHMEPFIFTFPPQVLKEVTFEHNGEEFIFVLSGTVEFQVGAETYQLSAGDCLYFDSSVPHRGRGKRGEAKALVVIYNPNLLDGSP